MDKKSQAFFDALIADFEKEGHIMDQCSKFVDRFRKNNPDFYEWVFSGVQDGLQSLEEYPMVFLMIGLFIGYETARRYSEAEIMNLEHELSEVDQESEAVKKYIKFLEKGLTNS